MIKGSVTGRAKVFADAVKWTAKFLVGKPLTPMQGGILLSIDDGMLSLLGFNESVTARAAVPIEGDGAGQAVVSGRLLAELAATFGDKPVTISGSDGDSSVTLTVGSWRGTLPVMTEGAFPAPPPPPAVVGSLLGDDLAMMIRRAATARSDSDKAALRWHLLHLSFDDQGMTAMATDMYRAARQEVPYSGEPGVALVHAATVLDVAEAFTGPDQIFVGIDDGAIGFASPTRAAILRQVIDEEYPSAAVAKLFAAEHPQHVRVKVKGLYEPLRRAQIVRDKEGPITVRFSENLITLAAASTELKRASDEEITAYYAGPDWSLKFNPGYFADALKTAPTEVVDIALTTEKISAVVLTSPGDDTWRHLLMPLR